LSEIVNSLFRLSRQSIGQQNTTIGLTITAIIATISLASATIAGVADASTSADVIHQNVADANNSNPNGTTDGSGNLHGIANVPGQNGTNPNDEGVAGFANQLENVHNGTGSKNKNAAQANNCRAHDSARHSTLDYSAGRQ